MRKPDIINIYIKYLIQSCLLLSVFKQYIFSVYKVKTVNYFECNSVLSIYLHHNRTQLWKCFI